MTRETRKKLKKQILENYDASSLPLSSKSAQEETKKIIGANIRRLRLQKGDTMRELAEELGVSSASISDWENAKTMPKAHTIDTLCEYFVVNLEDLVTDLPEYQRAKTPKTNDIIDLKGLLSGDTRLVFDEYLLTDAEKRQLMGTISAMLDFGRVDSKTSYAVVSLDDDEKGE